MEEMNHQDTKTPRAAWRLLCDFSSVSADRTYAKELLGLE